MRRIKTPKLGKSPGERRGSSKDRASVEVARRVLEIEARAVQDLIPRLGDRFSAAVNLLYGCKGKVVVSGMGKSGLIGQKISATLASTGTPSFFLHPADGLHGDLGMLARREILLAISNSGETRELLQLLPFMGRLGIPVISLVGRIDSTLAKNSAVVLDVSVAEEACSLGLAPTASTTASLALGDALAIALLEKRGFKAHDFAQVHPGGTLGRRLLVRVRDVMQIGTAVPRVLASASASVAIVEMSDKELGLTTVVDETGALVGIITDGDLRRFIQRGGNFSESTAGSLASRDPKMIGPDELAAKAVEMMERFSITSLVVGTHAKRVRGVVHLHDLLKHGIV